MSEVWKKIPGYPDFYEASNLGRVRLLPRFVLIPKRGGGGTFECRRPGRILSQCLNTRKGGYAQVNLSISGKHYAGKVHRMVCAAFHGAPPQDAEVNHKNGVKADNRPENLEWVSKSENTLHSYRELRRKKHARTKAVVAEGDGYGLIFCSMLSAAKHFGRTVGSVDAWVRGVSSPDPSLKFRYL